MQRTPDPDPGTQDQANGAHGYETLDYETLDPLTALVMRVLANPARLAIIRAVSAEPVELEPLAVRLRLSRSTLRRHLAQLAAAGVVRDAGGPGSARYELANPDFEDAVALIRHALRCRLRGVESLAELTLEGSAGPRVRRWRGSHPRGCAWGSRAGRG